MTDAFVEMLVSCFVPFAWNHNMLLTHFFLAMAPVRSWFFTPISCWPTRSNLRSTTNV
jgi:hypothetical protein